MAQLLSAFLLAAATTAAPAANQPRDAVEGLSGLPVPRFVSLGSGLANLRTGPGERYPVTWLYKRKGLPLKVVKEYGIWRQVEDPDGDIGWMHRNMLVSQRTGVVVNGIQGLRARPDDAARISWRVEPGVVGTLADCNHGWCRFSVGNRSGFIRYEAVWGVSPGETFE